jgi:dihydropteroate synthase
MNAGHERCSPGPHRAAHWKLRTQTLVVGKIPLLMGVINVTPDSFSDGAQFFRPAAAVERGLQLAAAGADLLDVGGQSTRPGSQPVDADEELRRVMPVVTALCEQTALPVSIDTSKAAVAREALAAGAQVLNDVTALTDDEAMPALAAETGCGVCAMHMRGTPRTMQEDPVYRDVVEDVMKYLGDRRDALTAAGVEQARIALDPGIGFGKTLEHNLTLLKNAWRFHALGCPLLVGHSRKRFIGEVLGDSRIDRTAGTIGVAVSLARQGVQILRVHDVAPVRQALLLYAATAVIEEQRAHFP